MMNVIWKYYRYILMIMMCFLILFGIIPSSPYYNVQAVGGWVIEMELDENTTIQTVDISVSGSDTIIVLGSITITSSFPHLIQDVEVTFNLDMSPTPYNMSEHLENNYIIDPDPIIFSRVLPNTIYQQDFAVSIYFDKYFLARNYNFSIEAIIQNKPGTISGTSEQREFIIEVNPYKAGSIEAPDNVIICKNIEKNFNISLNNLGNVEADINYQLSGLEDAADNGILITSTLGINEDPLLQGESRTWTFTIICDNVYGCDEVDLIFIWYKDSTGLEKYDQKLIKIKVMNDDIPQIDNDKENLNPIENDTDNQRDNETEMDEENNDAIATPFIGFFFISMIIIVYIFINRSDRKL